MKLTVVFTFFASSFLLASGKSVSDSRDERIQPRHPIVNGVIAEGRQFPYQVGMVTESHNRKSFCGGVLIADQWILTAAHCLQDRLSAEIFLGTTLKRPSGEEGRNTTNVLKDDFIVHEDYSALDVTNDIALIKLPFRIQYNDFISPASLPGKSSTYSSYDGKIGIVSGWGVTDDNAHGAENELRWMQGKIISNELCEVLSSRTIPESNICLDTRDHTSPCRGDSGGPMVLGDGSHTLVGLVSYGSLKGCEFGGYAAFARITSFISWIKEKTGISID